MAQRFSQNKSSPFVFLYKDGMPQFSPAMLGRSSRPYTVYVQGTIPAGHKVRLQGCYFFKNDPPANPCENLWATLYEFSAPGFATLEDQAIWYRIETTFSDGSSADINLDLVTLTAPKWDSTVETFDAGATPTFDSLGGTVYVDANGDIIDPSSLGPIGAGFSVTATLV